MDHQRHQITVFSLTVMLLKSMVAHTRQFSFKKNPILLRRNKAFCLIPRFGLYQIQAFFSRLTRISSLFRQVYIPTGLYSDRSIFRQVDIPTGRYSDRSLFRQVDNPTGRYSDRSLFRQIDILTGRYSDRSLRL